MLIAFSIIITPHQALWNQSVHWKLTFFLVDLNDFQVPVVNVIYSEGVVFLTFSFDKRPVSLLKDRCGLSEC